MGEYPAAYCRRSTSRRSSCIGTCPATALYQQFCCAFMQGVTDNRGGTVWIQPSDHGISGISSPVEIQLRGLEGAAVGHLSRVRRVDRPRGVSQAARRQRQGPRGVVGRVGTGALYRHRRLGADARRSSRRGAAGLFFAHAWELPGDFRKALAGPHPHRIRPGRRRPAWRERAGAAGCRLPFAAGGRGRAAVRAAGGRTGRELRDVAIRRELPPHGPTSRWPTCCTPITVDASGRRLRNENIYLTIDAEHPIVNDPQIHAKQATAWRAGLGPPPEKGDWL